MFDVERLATEVSPCNFDRYFTVFKEYGVEHEK